MSNSLTPTGLNVIIVRKSVLSKKLVRFIKELNVFFIKSNKVSFYEKTGFRMFITDFD